MLEELRVENLLLLERAELRLAPGLNVITGETGAGKTMLAQALDLLLGGRARSGIVRPGAAEAYVEGVFSLPANFPQRDERAPADATELVLARRVWPDGRTRAYICGRAATVGDLRELGGALLAFYGQHEHRKLTIAAAQLELLDAHCGPDQGALRERVASSHAEVRALERRCAELADIAGARERELDLLAFELGEIDELDPSEDEELTLAAEQTKLRALAQLREAAGAAIEALSPENGGGAMELLYAPQRELEAAAESDELLVPVRDRFAALAYEAEDLGRELRSYASGLEDSPGRLDEVEERLERYARLKRKHGGVLGDVLAHAEYCRGRIAELERADESLSQARAELTRSRAGLERLVGELSSRRQEGAPRLAEAVRARLEQLALPGAEFSIEIQPRPEGIGVRGADVAEFTFSANPGLPAAPLKEIASGGELSRVMLALLSAAHVDDSERGGPGPGVLVFDEIDAGIGGHTARAVGEHLQALGTSRQLVCITHLPQIASLAERHFRIEKASSGRGTSAKVAQLDGEELVVELVRMLGASEDDSAASEHARQLLRAA